MTQSPENRPAHRGGFGPSSFWGLLGEPERQMLRRVGALRRHPADAVILREGDPSGSVLVLLAGRAKVVADSADGSTTLLALRGPGDILGELSAVGGRRRVASVVALDPLVSLRLTGAQFDRILRENSAVAHAVLRVVSDRLHDESVRRVAFAASTAAQRLELLLAELSAQHGTMGTDGVQIALPFRQKDLADSIGASREAVVRGLKILRELGIVRTGRRQIIILQPDELRRRTRAL
jgi:CRP/FNR family transcriptional regulator, cyclic AMP receptor protein